MRWIVKRSAAKAKSSFVQPDTIGYGRFTKQNGKAFCSYGSTAGTILRGNCVGSATLMAMANLIFI